MKLGSDGALVPLRGFSRAKTRRGGYGNAWRSHDGLLVVSTLEQSVLPGGDGAIGPQWLVSVSRHEGGLDARCRVTPADVERVVAAFDMPAFDEDNHHPGVARHLWCPVDERYRSACECKTTERTIVDGTYAWTTDVDGPCRGCDYARDFGLPCPLHATRPS